MKHLIFALLLSGTANVETPVASEDTQPSDVKESWQTSKNGKE